jgi:lathosterol oxidase
MENIVVAATILVLIVAERLPAVRFRPLPVLRPYFMTDMTYVVTGVVALGFALRSWASPWATSLAGDWLPYGTESALAATVAVVLYDLGGFVSHRLLHRFEPLWRLHKVHHSSRALDWLAAYRGHILEHALRHALSPVALIVAGFPAGAVGLAAAVYAAFAALGHSNLRVDLRLLEPLLVTPRLHRLHHATATSEKNFGTVFSLWDRLAGTLVTTSAGNVEQLGVPGEVETYPQRWWPQLLEPLRWRPAPASVEAAFSTLAAWDGAAPPRAVTGVPASSPVRSDACSSRNAV